MATPLELKSSVEQIRERFDRDVERFSQLETGQTATMDAPLAMELITRAAVSSTAPIQRVLDIGCGAGNNSLKLRQVLGHDFSVDLVDLSRPMLVRAEERLRGVGLSSIRIWNEDFRQTELPGEAFDVILAAAVFHHLREDQDWELAFRKTYSALRPGGSIWITDLVWHETRAIQDLMWKRYGAYLVEIGGEPYRDKVLDYIDREDSPRPVTYQLELLRQVGYQHVELLHKNSNFAAFGGIKGYLSETVRI